MDTSRERRYLSQEDLEFRRETERQLAEEARLARRIPEPYYKSLPNKTLKDRIERTLFRLFAPF
jgi:hypothetical protein